MAQTIGTLDASSKVKRTNYKSSTEGRGWVDGDGNYHLPTDTPSETATRSMADIPNIKNSPNTSLGDTIFAVDALDIEWSPYELIAGTPLRTTEDLISYISGVKNGNTTTSGSSGGTSHVITEVNLSSSGNLTYTYRVLTTTSGTAGKAKSGGTNNITLTGTSTYQFLTGISQNAYGKITYCYAGINTIHGTNSTPGTAGSGKFVITYTYLNDVGVLTYEATELSASNTGGATKRLTQAASSTTTYQVIANIGQDPDGRITYSTYGIYSPKITVNTSTIPSVDSPSTYTVKVMDGITASDHAISYHTVSVATKQYVDDYIRANDALRYCGTVSITANVSSTTASSDIITLTHDTVDENNNFIGHGTTPDTDRGAVYKFTSNCSGKTFNGVKVEAGDMLISYSDVSTDRLKSGVGWNVINVNINLQQSSGTNTINQSQGTKRQVITNIRLNSTGSLSYIYADSIGANYYNVTSNAYKGEIFNDYANNIADDSFTHSEGSCTYTYAIGSHAEGRGEAQKAISSFGQGSHAEGKADLNYYIYSSNSGSHAEGHADEYNITSSGKGSHAEGHASAGNISAIGNGSHAEGDGTTAKGDSSHAEGKLSTANGAYSHAGGNSTYTNTESSFGQGIGIVTYSLSGEAGFGKYNESKSGTNQLFSVGNGTSNSVRSNLFAVHTTYTYINPQLRISNNSSTAAITANNSTVVCTNLNADLTDGYHLSWHTIDQPYKYDETNYTVENNHLAYKVIKISLPESSAETDVYDIIINSDTNYAKVAYYKLYITKYVSGDQVSWSLSLVNLGYVGSDVNLSVYAASDGNVYLQSNCRWGSSIKIKCISGTDRYVGPIDGYYYYKTVPSTLTGYGIVENTGGYRWTSAGKDTDNTLAYSEIKGSADMLDGHHWSEVATAVAVSNKDTTVSTSRVTVATIGSSNITLKGAQAVQKTSTSNGTKGMVTVDSTIQLTKSDFNNADTTISLSIDNGVIKLTKIKTTKPVITLSGTIVYLGQTVSKVYWSTNDFTTVTSTNVTITIAANSNSTSNTAQTLSQVTSMSPSKSNQEQALTTNLTKSKQTTITISGTSTTENTTVNSGTIKWSDVIYWNTTDTARNVTNWTSTTTGFVGWAIDGMKLTADCRGRYVFVPTTLAGTKSLNISWGGVPNTLPIYATVGNYKVYDLVGYGTTAELEYSSLS